jgi:ribonuclease-3
LSYERLEFLGDSVLGVSIAEHLYRRFDDRAEGELARIRAHVVSRESCAVVARELGLNADLAGRGRELGGDAALAADTIAGSTSVMAEVIEAVIGAAYLEFGPVDVMPAVVASVADRVAYAAEKHVDYKTVLQEDLARRGASVTYELVETTGPDHDRRYTTAAFVEGRELGRGSGPSKKASEQAAAMEALRGITGGAPPDY